MESCGESDVRSAAPALGGARRAAARGRSVTGNENSQMLTEKQVKLVRFHRFAVEGRHEQRSAAREACEKKGIPGEFQELKAVRGRRNQPDDADQIVKAVLS